MYLWFYAHLVGEIAGVKSVKVGGTKIGTDNISHRSKPRGEQNGLLVKNSMKIDIQRGKIECDNAVDGDRRAVDGEIEM